MLSKFRQILLLCVLLFTVQEKTLSQSVTPVDWEAIYQNAFTSLTYGVPFYILPPVRTYDNLTQQMDAINISSRTFFSANKYIGSTFTTNILKTDLYATDGGNRMDSLMELDFEIRGTTHSKAYSYFLERDAENKTAYFIIPGSNPDQSAQIYFKSSSQYDYVNNYHGDIAKLTSSMGDTYVYVKPNEDCLAIHDTTNRYKLNGDYLYNNLLTSNTPYGAYYLTQCIAYVKYLKKNYHKVVVIGLSQGGLASLLVSLATHPTASVVSTGYSVLFDDLYYAGLDQLNITGLFTTFNRDSVRNNIKAGNTQFLFSWGRGEEYAGYQNENVNHITERFLNDTLNTQYFYDFVNHVFPRPQVDSFLAGIDRRPIVTVRTQKENCNPDTTYLNLKFWGDKPPFTFSLYRNDTLVQTYTIPDAKTKIYITVKGQYRIQDITGQSGIKGIHSELLMHNPVSAMPQISQVTLDSNANSVNIEYKLADASDSAILKYRSGTDSSNTTAATLSEKEGVIVLQPGFYLLDSIFYGKKCETSVQRTVNVPRAYLTDASFSDNINQRTQIGITFAGMPPFQFRVTKDGNLLSRTFSCFRSDTIIRVPGSGLYQVTNITGDNGAAGFNSEPLGIVMTPRPVIELNGNVIQILTDTTDFTVTWSYNGKYMPAYDGQTTITAWAGGNYNCAFKNKSGIAWESNVVTYVADSYLQITPNPATSDNITVTLDDNLNHAYDITIYNIQGQRMLRRLFNSRRFNVNISNLPRGAYILEVRGKENPSFLYTKTFIKA